MIKNNKKEKGKSQEIDIELCIICMDENNTVLKEHPCQICDKKAWYCCEQCISKLKDCPICRSAFTINNDNSDNINSMTLPWYKKCYNNYNRHLDRHPFVSRCLEYFYAIILTGVIFFYILYLGKVITYIFCTSNCDKEENSENNKGCECYDLTQKDYYWTDLDDNMGSNVGVGIISNIIITIIYRLKCRNNSRRNN